MRQLCLILAITLFPISLFCQPMGDQVLDSEIRYQWDSVANDWVMANRTDYLRDSMGNQVKVTIYSWDPGRCDWIPSILYENKYDSSDNMTSQSFFIWDTTVKKWINVEQALALFDSAGNKIETSSYSLDTTTGDTLGGWRQLIDYDSLGNQTKYTKYFWDTNMNEWLLSGVTDYKYDSLGFQIESTSCYYWDDDDGECDYSSRETFVYDDYGNLTEMIFYTKIFKAGDLIPQQRIEYVYDSAGNRIEETEYIRELGSWEEYSHCVSVFNSLGNQIEKSCQERDYYTNESIGFKTIWSWSYDLIWDQVISAAENCQDCYVLAPIITGSNYKHKQLLLTITAGNDHNLFVLDTVNGNFQLIQDSILDFETISIHKLRIAAQFEDSTRTYQDSATMTVYVQNVNDNAPVLHDTTVTVSEDIQGTWIVCTLKATDADGNLDTLKYSISAGNGSNIFSCKENGTLVLDLFDSIDYEKQKSYSLTVEVTDGVFIDEGSVFIQVLDVDETYINSVDASGQIMIYPNPVNNHLHIKVPAELLDGFETIIVDLSGRVMYHQSGYLESIELSSFRRGVYIITIKSKDFVATRKILKL